MRKLILAILAVLITSSIAIAGNSNAGKNAYTFLKIGMSAKEESMAGAYVGLADDASSINNNPAGLAAPVYDLRGPKDYYEAESEDQYEIDAELKELEFKPNRFFATYINYLLDFQSGYLGYARTLNETSSLGISIQYQDYGSFDKLNSFGEPSGTFSAYDMAFGLTYSKRISTAVALGITGKFILAKIDSLTSDGMAVDMGALYRFDDGRTSLGLAIKNLGSQLKGFTKSHKDPLPLMFDVGLSHSLRGLPLTINTDVTIPTDNDVFFALGGQWESFKPFFIRFGWSSLGQDYRTGSDKDNFGGLAGGFGYQFQDYHIDYSYSSFADIGNVHRVSLGVEF